MNASKKIMNQGKKEETISTSSAPKTNSKVKLGGASDGPGMKTYVLCRSYPYIMYWRWNSTV